MRYSLLLVILVLFPMHSTGQTVYRCTNDNGPTVFQDAPCDRSDTEDLIELEPNVVDSSRMRANTARQNRLSAALAEKRARAKEERKQARLERRKEEAERAALVKELRKDLAPRKVPSFGAYPAPRPAYPDPAYPEPPEYPEPRIPEGPAKVTNCNLSGCWDISGRRYNSGAGSTHFRDDGEICQRKGDMMHCW